MKKYRHLTERDRIFLRIMLEKLYSKARIARILKVDPSTVYREIKRNSCIHSKSGHKFYWNHIAHQRYLKRRKRGLRLEKDRGLREYVHSKLKSGWSPYQIEGRLKLENDNRCVISHESIYQYIYSNGDRRYLLYKYLRRRHSYRIKSGQRKPRIPAGLMIASRPERINSRLEFGHWECDLMMFRKGIKTNLITLRERNTRYLLAIKNQSKEAEGTALALINTLKGMKHHVRSITFDQGSEFKRYEWIRNCVGADIYFCEAGAPYQKGAVENGNSILRVELPRTFDIETLRQKEISKLTGSINNRPLKCLGYKTPAESFHENTKQNAGIYEN